MRKYFNYNSHPHPSPPTPPTQYWRHPLHMLPFEADRSPTQESHPLLPTHNLMTNAIKCHLKLNPIQGSVSIQTPPLLHSPPLCRYPPWGIVGSPLFLASGQISMVSTRATQFYDLSMLLPKDPTSYCRQPGKTAAR